MLPGFLGSSVAEVNHFLGRATSSCWVKELLMAFIPCDLSAGAVAAGLLRGTHLDIES